MQKLTKDFGNAVAGELKYDDGAAATIYGFLADSKWRSADSP